MGLLDDHERVLHIHHARLRGVVITVEIIDVALHVACQPSDRQLAREESRGQGTYVQGGVGKLLG